MNKIKHIIFDFDHTLAYRDGMWSPSMLQILQENGISNISIEDIRVYIKDGFPWDFYEKSHDELFEGKSWWEFLEAFVQRIYIANGLDRAKAEELSKLIKGKYLDTSYWYLYDDSIEVLKQLKECGYQCHILSNHTPELPDLIDYLGLSGKFDKLFNSAVIGYEKPNKRIYEYVLNELDAEPSEVVMVGDNIISDITGARSNGMHAIWVNWKEEGFKFTNQVKKLSMIIDLIKQLNT